MAQSKASDNDKDRAMTPIELTAEQASAELEQIMMSMPDKQDHRYEPPGTVSRGSGNSGCAYFHGDKPGCFIGHLLALHGVKRADLISTPDAPLTMSDVNMGAGPLTLASSGILRELDDVALEFLGAVQEHQDEGDTWGVALQKAREAWLPKTGG